MSDLKLIDELLCDLKSFMGIGTTWGMVYHHSSAARKAMDRLCEAWRSDEIGVGKAGLTLGLVKWIEEQK